MCRNRGQGRGLRWRQLKYGSGSSWFQNVGKKSVSLKDVSADCLALWRCSSWLRGWLADCFKSAD